MSLVIADEAREKRNARTSYILLAILALGILAMAARSGWRSPWVVDSRTQVEMIRGIADHGLPYTTNGPVSTYVELQARWNVARGDQLWSLYPPLYAYVAQPFFRLGGLAAVSRMNMLFVLLFAAGTFFVARRFLRAPLLAVAVTYIAVLSTPVAATAMDISSFILAETLVVWSLFLAMLALESRRFSMRLAIAAGFLGGCAITSHLLIFPMVVGLILAMAQPGDDIDRATFADSQFAWLSTWWPTRSSSMRAACMALGAALPLVPLALLNHLKFGSYNPISYGPCVWASCAETGIDQQSIGIMLRYAGPTVLLVLSAGAAAWFFRRDRLGLGVVAIVFVATLFSSWNLTDHSWQIFKILWAYVVDVTWIHMPELARPPDKIGHLLGAWVVRSMLQCTPILVLAPFVKIQGGRDRRLVVLLSLPSMMLFGVCALRANEPAAYALGFPCIFLRYTVPALAPLLVLAVSAAKHFSWRRKHATLGLALSIAIVLATTGHDDFPLWRRLLLLYLTLGAAGITVFFALRTRKTGSQHNKLNGAMAATMAIALGVGSTVGVTFRALRGMRDECDARMDAIAAELPQRFALVGFPPDIDTPLGLRTSRDVEYLDLYEATRPGGWTHFGNILDVWVAQGRPVFLLGPPKGTIPPPSPDFVFEEMDAKQRLFRVSKK